MITKEKLDDFVSRAYACSCSHGFHDVLLSERHLLMLVLSEVGEMVEADRRGYGGDLGMFDDALRVKSFRDCFLDYVKDSVNDEMSDVAIRLFDMCGAFDIDLSVLDKEGFDGMCDEFEKDFGSLSFCERCYVLCSILCNDTGNGVLLEDRIGSALVFLFCMARDMCVDLERHIELKMKYNELRPKKHGKKY